MSDDPYAPFVPRRGRYVALAAGTAVLLIFIVIALGMPGGEHGYGPGDRLLFGGIGLAIAAVMGRYAAIRATPDRDGIVIRNLFLTREIPWAQVESVKYAPGDPWPSLMLHDADQVAVMAIQRSDGPVSVDEAQRLADLVGR